MTPLGWIATTFLVIAVISSSRRWALVFLLAGCILLTPNQSVVLVGLRFPVLRILILAGFLRVIIRHERPVGKATALDKYVLFWMLWSVLISFFQPFEEGSGPIYAVGTMINVVGVFYLFRIWTGEPQAIRLLLGSLAILLVPIAVEMLFEQATGRNLFGFLGGVNEFSLVRAGHIRANATFRHPILAGTVGAVCFPLMVALYHDRKITSLLGMASCVLIVLASRSSGPLMSLFAAIGCICLWRFRRHYRLLFAMAIGAYVMAELLMSKPAYYLMARIDLSGGSTGLHRVYLLDAFFKHFRDWWFAGTNYTRDWMPFGVSFSDKHTDITSYYIAVAITSGLVGLLFLITILSSAIRSALLFSRRHEFAASADTFLAWCLASGMAAHAATSISVSYFDQSICFFWMNVSLLGSIQAIMNQTQGEN